ncbi:hypothetical protein BO78DRAFT_422537 [Aspergillus sclerotiicarbonarius CBS 121057]|uniref:Uncharacterized protein n=1 Tax=Aspergillus sclerotiicarbonarius (strain CBS 121057 / IBT 28362) TaxID=1448318 RepID=A0A319DXF9_ASPSB|nr:hypothetical protein BO78DRAFT_422537 [Aspergillus sclerotiicarbonarius CBS 121057]
MDKFSIFSLVRKSISSCTESDVGHCTMADKQQKRARDTLSLIYSYYKTNENTIENVPSWISNSSGDIPIAVDIPTAAQTEECKETLKELTAIKQVIDGIPARERQMMLDAAYASTIRRKDNKK